MRTKPGGRKESVRGCECDWCENHRRMSRRRHKLIEIGRPARVTDEEYERARDRLLNFHTLGMSCDMMSEQARLSDSTVSQLIQGTRSTGKDITGMNRSTYEKIMAIRFVEPPATRGAHRPYHGTRRRLQALALVGYGYGWLAKELGLARAHTARLANGGNKEDFVTYGTWKVVKEAYEKYRDVDPLDVGVTHYNVVRQKNASLNHGYAPASAWDDDLIDDPSAYPEWTGACGTRTGVHLHRKHSIPLRWCRPCSEEHYLSKRKANHE